MRTGKDIHLVVPVFLLEQISTRAQIAGRTRAAELRYLLSRGLELAGESDISIDLPGGGAVRRALVSPRHEVFDQVLERSERFERSLATEALRMIAHAIEVSTTMNLDDISSLTSRSDRSALGTPRTASL